jgi:hypothetical protein
MMYYFNKKTHDYHNPIIQVAPEFRGLWILKVQLIPPK